MAEVTARKRNGKWEYRFEGASIGGKRKQYSRSGFKTKKEALEAGAKAFNDYVHGGQVLKPSQMSVSDYLDFYEENVISGYKYNTQRSYKQSIRLYIKPYIGRYSLSSLTPAILQQWVSDLRRDVGPRATCEKTCIVLRQALSYAVHPCEYIVSNPMLYVRNPKVDTSEIYTNPHPYLTNEQFFKLLSFFDEHSPERTALLLGWTLGMRIGEVFGLTWDDIDFKTRTLKVSRQAILINEKGKGLKYQLTSTKSETSLRRIPLGPDLIAMLQDVRVWQMENEMYYGQHYTTYTLDKDSFIKIRTDSSQERCRLILIHENGTMYARHSLSTRLYTLKKRKLIDFDVDFHGLRKSNATNLVDMGVEIKVVQSRLGHKDVNTTLNTYVQATERQQEKAVDVADSLLSPTSDEKRGQIVGCEPEIKEERKA